MILPNSYAVSALDNNMLLGSSSGGVFGILAKHYLQTLKGVVYGAIINKSSVYHERVNDIRLLSKLCKSKYVKSLLKNTFQQCASDLKNGYDVFFVGTPCQIYALKTYLNLQHIDMARLLTADLICHGVPQRKYWDKFLQEKFPNEDVLNVDFRTKKKNKNVSYFKVVTNKKKYFIPNSKNEYFTAFIRNYILSKSCFTCKFKGENRYSDLTIGDFWGIEDYYPEYFDKNGNSIVVIRNKESFILDILRESAKVHKTNYFLSLKDNPSYFYPAYKPNDFDTISDQMDKDFLGTIKLISKISLVSIFKSNLAKIIKKMQIKKVHPLKKNSVGIITDSGYTNYGNRLQNFALRTYIEQRGFHAYNVNLTKYLNFPFSSFVHRIFNFLQYLFIKNKRPSLRKKSRLLHASFLANEKNIYFDYSKAAKINLKKLQTIIVGSDQVWNWTYNRPNLLFNLGVFGIEESPKVISYAASIGIDHFPEDLVCLYESELRKFPWIGVRERKAVEILKKIGVTSELNADPVFLLSSFDWRYAYRKYSKLRPKNKYVLVYCLEITPESLSSINDFEIIDLHNKKSFARYNHFDFVNLIDNAEYIITDSFHAFCFSIIFRKKIILGKRIGMESRIFNLFELLCVEAKFNNILDLNKIDYKNLHECIEKSKDFLKQGLEQK